MSFRGAAIPFWLLHVAALGVFFVPSRWSNVGSSSRCTASAPSASRPREHGTYLGDRTLKWLLDVESSAP
jgi:hypothetical protein